ncbi:neuropeptide receptor npr-1-like [Magallana gigas]|uniref:neuropeptide receptor npr-1-like n=1 Tax=Magallana gigas TaxID=29159 RepID=UPI00333EEF79
MNYTAENYNLNFQEKMYFNTALTSFLLLLGLAGNSVILYFYACRMPRTENRYFIPYLALADLLACICGGSFALIINFYSLTFHWDFLCKGLCFSTAFTSSYSAAMLLVIAVNRYLKVCRTNGHQLTGRTRKIVLLFVLTISIITKLPMLFLMGRIEGSVEYNGIEINVTSCGVIKDRFGTYAKLYFFSEYTLIFLIMIFTVALYILIGITIYNRFNSIRSSKPTTKGLAMSTSILSEDVGGVDKSSETKATSTPNYTEALQNVLDSSISRKKNSHRRRVRHNFTSMFVTIVIFYIMSYLPTFVLVIVPSKNPFRFWFTLDDFSLNILVFLKRAFIVNHIVNPFVYGYFDLHFRSLFKKSLGICQ